MIVKVKEKIGSSFAVSAEKGQIIYRIIIENFMRNEKVILDFEGISSTISTFFNSSYAILFSDYSKAYIEENIEFKNLKEITKHQIQIVKENAIKFYKKES